MCAVIIRDPVIGGAVCVIDVRVAARHGVVRRAIPIGKCHVVCSDEAVAAIANLGASAMLMRGIANV